MHVLAICVSKLSFTSLPVLLLVTDDYPRSERVCCSLLPLVVEFHKSHQLFTPVLRPYVGLNAFQVDSRVYIAIS
jgi:hypothetical protein